VRDWPNSRPLSHVGGSMTAEPRWASCARRDKVQLVLDARHRFANGQLNAVPQRLRDIPKPPDMQFRSVDRVSLAAAADPVDLFVAGRWTYGVS
jgi:hypothetical protein